MREEKFDEPQKWEKGWVAMTINSWLPLKLHHNNSLRETCNEEIGFYFNSKQDAYDAIKKYNNSERKPPSHTLKDIVEIMNSDDYDENKIDYIWQLLEKRGLV